MASWDVNALLLRQILFTVQGANWQRAGGKGTKPKPVPLPDQAGRGGTPAPGRPAGADIAARLRNLGMIPGGSND